MDIYTYGNPFIPLVKRAMAQRGVITGDTCSRPFLPPTAEQDRRIAQLLDALHLGKVHV
jgi:dihydrodipicolinate synthase/N-acetylneuraminate lyase